ncbi:hypothetical protein JCM10213v2_009067 [Rhodosporidiobolus nylandii]
MSSVLCTGGVFLADLALRFPIIHPPSFFRLHNSDYLAAALTTLDHALLETSLETVVVMLLLAIYALKLPRGPGAWILCGKALSLAVSISLHQEKAPSALAALGLAQKAPSPLEVEMRRRIFWSLYSLEVATAAMLGRPPSVPSIISTPLPTEVDIAVENEALLSRLQSGAIFPSASTTNMSFAIHTFRLRQIEAKILEAVYRGQGGASEADAMALVAELTLWWTQSPRLGRERPELACWFEMRFHFAVLLLHQQNLLQAKAGDAVIETCAISAAALCSLSEAKSATSYPASFPLLSLHTTFLAGITFLLCIRLDPSRPSLDLAATTAACEDCAATLALFLPGWSAAPGYLRIFRTLAAETLAILPAHPSTSTAALGAVPSYISEAARAPTTEALANAPVEQGLFKEFLQPHSFDTSFSFLPDPSAVSASMPSLFDIPDLPFFSSGDIAVGGADTGIGGEGELDLFSWVGGSGAL